MTEPNCAQVFNPGLPEQLLPDCGWIALSEVLAMVLAALERDAEQESAGG